MRQVMKGVVFGIAAGLLGTLGGALLGQIVSTLPFTLQNSTVADATQVMANFNQIVNNVNANSAKNGVNSDITALSALSTPITPAQGGTTEYIGGTSTGTANAQLVTATPTGFALTAPYRVVFVAGFSNTGATTLNVNGTGVRNIYRVTSAGVVPLVGGEIIAGAIVEASYDGTQFQLHNTANNVPVGTSITFRGTAAPSGYLLEDGSCVSRTTYAVLFGVISTTYSVCDGSTTFGLPDARGRLDAGKDNMGGSAANRITNAGSGCTGTTLGLGCGGQNVTLAQANLPNATLTGITDLNGVDHTHSAGFTVNNIAQTGSAQARSIDAGTNQTAGASAFLHQHNVTTSSINGNVTQTATILLNPLLIANRAIKY